MMRPVLEKHVRYHELFDGTYDIDKIADLHEMLDEAAEIRRRLEPKK